MLNISLHIAVTGNKGAGKSTFITALRGLGNADNEGVAETTSEPASYKHPDLPNVTLWDLPGVGGPNFPMKTYLKKVQFDRYDFFIIISSERFKENDIMLAKEIQKRKKQFYFIRSKIDNDIRAEERKRNFNRDQTLSTIRRDCEGNLKGIRNPRVFLISSLDLSSYDFEELVNTLMAELPEHKRKALLQSVPVSSMAILEKKVKMFQKAAWAAASLSAGIAVVQLPGPSFACDACILATFFTTCYYSFGLNNKAIKRLSKRVNKPHLMTLKNSSLPLASNSRARLLLIALVGAATVKHLCSLEPHLGASIAAFMSFGLTYKLLQKGLNDLAAAARTVLREAGLP